MILSPDMTPNRLSAVTGHTCRIAAVLVSFLVGFSAPAASLAQGAGAPTLSPMERKIRDYVRAHETEQVAFLEKAVNISSGTFNLPGVRAVGRLFEPEFAALGFQPNWIALPDAYRNGQASFQHIEEVPIIEQGGGVVSVFAGFVPGCSSPAKHFSPVLGADVAVHALASLELPLDSSFEHAALLVTGDAEIDGQSIDSMNLSYLGTNRSSVEFKSRDGCRVLLIGGPPFPEKILMWWNFVARTPEEIAQARSDWQSHQRFGEVRYRGPRLDAPPLKRFAPPNPVS